MLVWACVLTSHGRGMHRHRTSHAGRHSIFLEEGSFEGSNRKDVTFVTTRFTKEGEFEVRVSHKGIKGIETVIPNEGEEGLFYRQVTNGKRLVSSIYTDKAHLVDCDVSIDEDQLITFMDKFLGSEDTYLDASKGLGERNVTMQVLENDQLPDIYKPLINFSIQVKECKQLHRELKRIQKQRKRKSNSAKTVAADTFLLDGEEDIKKKPVSGSSVSHSRQKRAMLIYPGTKWCGSGSVSAHWEDLGHNIATDKCCRSHDHCPYTVEGFTTKYDLFNYMFHTLSHCHCDIT